MFEVDCVLNRKIKLTKERYFHIVSRHPEILDKEQELKEALIHPTLVKRSVLDNDTVLFYKSHKQEYIVVVVKLLKDHGFIITSYITDFIRDGEIIWKR